MFGRLGGSHRHGPSRERQKGLWGCAWPLLPRSSLRENTLPASSRPAVPIGTWMAWQGTASPCSELSSWILIMFSFHLSALVWMPPLFPQLPCPYSSFCLQPSSLFLCPHTAAQKLELLTVHSRPEDTVGGMPHPKPSVERRASSRDGAQLLFLPDPSYYLVLCHWGVSLTAHKNTSK